MSRLSEASHAVTVNQPWWCVAQCLVKCLVGVFPALCGGWLHQHAVLAPQHLLRMACSHSGSTAASDTYLVRISIKPCLGGLLVLHNTLQLSAGQSLVQK
jgi:hypothetical protein